MAYNKQVNPYGVSSSELVWKGFADGGRHGNPATPKAPESSFLSDVAKLGISAVLDESNGYFSPSATKKVVGGDMMQGAKTAQDALMQAAIKPGATEADQLQLKRDSDFLKAHQGRVAASKDYNKTIYDKAWYQFGDVADPRTQVLARNVDNKYTDTSSLQQPSIFDSTFSKKYYEDGKKMFGTAKKSLSEGYNETKSDASNWLDKHNFWRD